MTNNTTMPYNQTDDWNENYDGPSLLTRITFACAWMFIAVSGILGNGLVIFVAVRFQKLSNVTNCFIVNLAITDILFLAFCMPLLVVQYTLDIWLFNQIFCKLMNFISFLSVLVTVLTLVAMTIDRYIYVVRPYENLMWRKPKTVLVLSIIIWLISSTLASPFYYYYGVTNMHDDNNQCVLLGDEQLQKYFCIYTITLYYFTPLIIIIVSYAKLLCYVYSKENKIQLHTTHGTGKKSKKRRAVTKMVAIVTLAFSLCWLPITLYIILAYIFPQKSIFLYYYKVIANSLAYLNSAINPILYAFLNRSFRNNCGSLFYQQTCSSIIHDDHPSSTKLSHVSRKHPPSTQNDRFSYQSTNNQSSLSSSLRDKRRKQASRTNNNNNKALVPTNSLLNEHSDIVGDTFNDESVSHVSPKEKSRQYYYYKGKYEEISVDDTNASSTLTTSL